jgi:hypothetical protein
MARRAFPDPGSYPAYLRVTNGAGEQSTAERIVTVTPPPQTAGPRVRAGVKPARVNGPFDLSALALRKLAAAPRTPIVPRSGQYEDLETGELPGVRPVASCRNLPVFAFGTDDVLLKKSFERPLPGRDPQIAASSTHLVVTTNGQIEFLSKDASVLTELVTAGPAAKLVTYSFTPLDFFKGMFGDINANLPLPQAYRNQDLDPNGAPDTPYHGWGWVLVDYPQIGVSPQYFVVTFSETAVGMVHVVDAADLANGTYPAPTAGKPPCGHYLRIGQAPKHDTDPVSGYLLPLALALATSPG